MNRTLPAFALTALVALSGCAGLGSFGDRYGSGRYGGNNDYYESGRYDDRYADSGYYRAVERDAREYANAVDRYLRISNREERAVRDIVERRAYDLLQQTNARDHDRVYPFPRRPGRAERFWAVVDRDVDQILDRRYREPYAYYNRYGSDRYQEYYRYRRYDDRAGWVDTRTSDRRTPRRAQRSDRQEEARAAQRVRERREEARRENQRATRERRQVEARREEARRVEARRENARRAERERGRREEARREETRRENARREAARERTERARSERSRERRRAEETEKKKSETPSRRRTRRGGNND